MKEKGVVIKKVDKLDAHDRYQELSKHGINIAQCCQNLIDQRPFGNHPFYIFAHTRTHENGIDRRIIWQPRLTKPKAQTNSMLFKAYPGSDTIKVIWMIPDRQLWSQYSQGLITENKLVSESIYDFQFNKKKLEEKEEDDMSDEQIDLVYKEISFKARHQQREDAGIANANNLSSQPEPFKMV